MATPENRVAENLDAVSRYINEQHDKVYGTNHGYSTTVAIPKLRRLQSLKKAIAELKETLGVDNVEQTN